jgi:hypothetical protein
MPQPTPLLLSTDAPSAGNIVTASLDNALDGMLLETPLVSPDDFSDEWGAADTEEALALSGALNARLKDYIVAALALVWASRQCTPHNYRHVIVYSTRTSPICWLLFIGQGGGRRTYCAPSGYRKRNHSHFYSLANPFRRRYAQV